MKNKEKELPDGYYYFNYSVSYNGEEILCDILAIKTPNSVESSAIFGSDFYTNDPVHLSRWVREFMHIYLPLDFDDNIKRWE